MQVVKYQEVIIFSPLLVLLIFLSNYNNPAMTLRGFYLILISFFSVFTFFGCIEDSFTTSPSDQPWFASDTVKLGNVFTEEGTPTTRFLVYNRHDKMLNISRISMRSGGLGSFRINVDGHSGKEFFNVEIRPNDSIFIFVEATLPSNGRLDPVAITDILDFETNGQVSSIVLHAVGQDARRLKGVTITKDTVWEADLPRIVYDSLVVAPGARLTIRQGVRMHFHDKASFIVYGSLHCDGSPEYPVIMEGDRTGDVISGVSFDIMASQWGGLQFCSSSSNNRLNYTMVRNTEYGVLADSTDLQLLNCRLHNSAFMAIATSHSKLTAIGCELSDAAEGVVYIRGGEAEFNHCTIANYYLFSALGGAAVQLAHTGMVDKYGKVDDDESGTPYLNADFSNCIIYGNGADFSHSDLKDTSVKVNRCLLKSNGSDDDNFVNCIWGEDPLYYTIRAEYIFDYRLHSDSPAIGAADPDLTSSKLTVDYYGTPRLSATLGAYEPLSHGEDQTE